MPATQTDESLFLSYREQGNADALSILYGRYDARLIRFIMHQKRLPLADAEDIVQDAWYRAITKRHQYHNSGLFRSWFVSIVLNRASDYLRQRHRRDQLRLKRVCIAVANPIDSLIDLDWFHSSISRMPGSQRACLALTYVDGLTMRQIARQLGIAPSTVGRQISRAIETLRATIDLNVGPRRPMRNGRQEARIGTHLAAGLD
jgi:RNA polymerase sigma-70 factor (ECF subfamily)